MDHGAHFFRCDFQVHTPRDTVGGAQAASAGQQATALLGVLLRQHGQPLIIDQPEDDLDNEVILNVAEQLWEAKAKRRLIFASHSANLVVNGDADLVVACEYRVAGDHSR